jgi:NTP pyrophosphatase (non-canonical NTP hydrolase)
MFVTARQAAHAYLERVRRARPKQATLEARMFKLMEEAGEVQKAFNRLHGYARVFGSKAELADELADVVICAYALAEVEEIDLNAAIDTKHTTLVTRDLGREGLPVSS